MRIQDKSAPLIANSPWAPSDPLGQALHLLRMRGSFYSLTEARLPWSFEMPAVADTVSFHAIMSGACWLELPGAEAVELRAGDFALVPHGRGHTIVGERGWGPSERVDLLPQRFIGDHYSMLTHGGSGAATRLLCGIVTFDEPAARALLRTLPAVIHVGAASGTVPSLIRDTINLLFAELADMRPGGEAVTTRLADILVVQAVRSWLDQDPAARLGWLGAIRDPYVGRALAAMHRDPGHAWTLERLAAEAAMSRSSFALRFTELVGEPAMTYLTRWRMNQAHARLAGGGATVSQVAAESGYRSDAAFTRAFARVTGETPGAVRRRGAG